MPKVRNEEVGTLGMISHEDRDLMDGISAYIKEIQEKMGLLWKIQGIICIYNCQIQQEICHLEDGPHSPCWHADLGPPRFQNCEK